MLRALVVILSIALYGTVAWAFLVRSDAVDFSKWPADPTAKRFWTAWVIFLFALSPLSFASYDMAVWTTAMDSAVTGRPFPSNYVYLPIYAQVLGALVLPFYVVGAATPLVCMYIVHIPIFAAYLYCAKLMAEMIPRHAAVAPLAIVLAPVTIFYIFFGTNHIVMFACLLAALQLLHLGKSFSAGVLAALGCYKFLLIPTVFVLGVILAATTGWKRTMRFLAGGGATLLPSFIYYYFHPQYLVRTVGTAGGMGGHAYHIEPFHALYLIRDIGGFGDWYAGNKVWLYLACAGALLSAILYLRGRLNALQSLGLSAGIVALFSVEPFRLEPTIGLLWMDAVERRDMRLQTAALLLLFVHAAAWFYPAYPRFLTFYEPAAPLFNMNGAAVGIALVYLLFLTVQGGCRHGLLSDLSAAAQQGNP